MRKDGKLEKLPNSDSGMLGVFDFLDFTDEYAQLDEGDMLMMYTDGIDEACNVKNEVFTDERMEQVLRDSKGLTCQAAIDKMLECVRAFASGAPQSDDITMMALKRE